MTITFVCRSSKVSKKDGLTPLELYVIIDGKRRFVSLNRKIDPKLFNPKKQIVRGDTQTNEYIEAVRMKCYALETEMLKRGLLLTVDTFVYAFRHGIRQNSISTYGLFDKFMEKQLEKKNIGLITRRQTAQDQPCQCRCGWRWSSEHQRRDLDHSLVAGRP